MVTVKRRSDKESPNSLLRRFNRRVQQAGVVKRFSKNRYFTKPLSKSERRVKAIKASRRRFYRFIN